MAKRQTRGAAVKPEPEVLEPEVVDQDALVIADTGRTVSSFLGGVVEFFTRARVFEQQAQQTLEEARALKMPRNGAEDAAVQRFAKRTSELRKAVEDHWQITSTVHQFHKRLVARRQIASSALESASIVANNLHNTYTAEERKRAAAEAMAARRAAEERARQEREVELARLEEEALRREATSQDLSAREQQFVEAYLFGIGVRGNPVESARRAGYKDPAVQGPRLLTTPKVKAALEGQQQAALIRQQAAARREEPVDVEVPVSAPDIQKVHGERTTWAADLLDEQALILAVIAGKHGIPLDVLQVNRVKLNEYARALHERIDLWPGVRHRKTTKVV